MTTYSGTGLTLNVDPVGDPTGFAGYSPYSVTLAGTTTSFSYVFLPPVPPSDAEEVSPDFEVLDFSIAGVTGDGSDIDEFSMGEFQWEEFDAGAGEMVQRAAFAIYVFIGATLTIIPIGGDALPTFADLTELGDFLDAGWEGSPTAGSGYEAGVVVPLPTSGELGTSYTEDDTFAATGGNDTVFTGDGADMVFGLGGFDEINGEAGNDTLNGGNDNDFIYGGDDDDVIRGQGGNDSLFGGADDDIINGGVGSDLIVGGAGADTVLGQASTDYIYGGGGNDNLSGGSGNDEVYGGDDNDNIYGQGNNDTLFGEDGNDSIFGAAGFDSLFGGAGDDKLFGGNGNDILEGGAGSDTLSGGLGTDTFIFSAGDDDVRINSYDQGVDKLDMESAQSLWGGGLSGQQVVDTYGSLNGNSTILTLDFGGGTVLQLQNAAGLDLATLGDDILPFT